MKILANDGIANAGKEQLEAAGFEVVTEKVAQEDLANSINNEGYVGVLVRSATTVRKEVIDACPGLKLIGRGGVGMDNIDVEYAREKGIHVINTPAASSQSVAELVFGHLFSMARFLHDSNRNMPSGDFKTLKKKYGKGTELRGKTLGVIGLGRIGTCVAQYGLGCGMKVIAHTKNQNINKVPLAIYGAGNIEVELANSSMDDLLAQSDFISINVPAQANGKAVIGAAEFAKMKDGVMIVNASRGGIVDESALLEALESGKVAQAALDVFTNEPNPDRTLLAHPNISLTPHIGAATGEAQERIGTELAGKIIELLN